jgi:hypothetical protein
MVTTTAVLVSTTTQHIPLISQAQVDHDAYRALEAGLNEYLFVANQDPSSVTCNAAQYALYVAGTGGSVCSAFATAGIKFGQWNQVNTHTGPNVAPEWFLFGDPTAVTNTTQNSNSASIRLSVVGAAGYPQGTSNGTVEYQSANVALSPADGFLLNVWWTDFEVGDPFQTPPVSGGVSELNNVTTCPYFWQVDPKAGTKLSDGSTFDGSTNADPCMGAPITGSGGAAGDHLVTATYSSGNSTYGGGAASLTEQVVSGTTATTTSVTASPTAPALNQSVTYSATVSQSAANGDTIAFTDNGTTISGCSNQPVTSGEATCTVSGGYPAQSNHVITATYSGDAVYATSAGSKTVFVGSSAFGTTATGVTVTGPTGTLNINSSVTYTATLTPTAAATSNTIGFTDNGTAISGCTATAINTGTGKATCTISAGYAAAGYHSITATYLGTGGTTYAPSAGSLLQKVGTTSLPTTTTTATTSGSPIGTGTGVTYTATIGSWTSTYAGTVKFTDNGAAIGGCASQSVTSGNGTATCTLGASAYTSAGIHVITATYVNSNSKASDSAGSVTETVQAPTNDPGVTISSSKQVLPCVLPTATSCGISSGWSVTYTATVASGASNGTVSFTDGGQPIVSFKSYGNNYSSPPTYSSICQNVAISNNKATCTISGGYGLYGAQWLIQFITGDQLAGATYSNDTVFICGSPQFDGPLKVQDNDQQTAAAPGGGCSNNPTLGTGSAFDVSPETLPSTNTFTNLASTASTDGCLYTGPTVITLKTTAGTPPVQTYSVTSPDTPTTPSGGGYVDANNASGNGSICVNAAAGTDTPEAGIPLPKNGVIYVQTQTPCTATVANPLLVPYPSGDWYSAGTTTAQQDCEGDVIVQGTLSGSLSIVADNDVVVDNNITYYDCPPGSAPPSTVPPQTPAGFATLCPYYATGTTNDVLGLIAQNDVEVNNPDRGSTGADGSTCMAGTVDIRCTPNNITIDAGILALDHSFINNNYSQNNQGTLSVFGAIAQKFRGPVGQGSNGFLKNYQWDPRLGILSPPDYLAPGTASWELQAVSVTVGKCVLQWPLNLTSPPIVQSQVACNLGVGQTPGVP